MLYPCSSKSKEIKENKEKENRNDLAILSSHDTTPLLSLLIPRNLSYNS